MIRNPFSFGRNRGVVFATLLVIITLGAAYFFVYVPNNQRALEEKQFRCLQNAAQNISDKIDNSLATLNNLMSNYQPFSKAHNNAKLLAYINNYPTKNFTLTLDTNYIRVKTNPEPAPGTISDTSIIFNERTLSIHIVKKNACIGITYTFKQFIEPLLPQKIFDEYIVFRESDLIYQSFQSGITQLVSDSLKKDKSAFNAEQVKDISLSGTTYKFFSQQINLKAAAPITIVGLLTKEHYGEEKNKLPEQAVLFLLMLAIAGILALPWIKLYQMGSNDRMTAADGLFSLTVPMLLMSILVFAFLSYNTLFRYGTPASEIMAKNLADSIKGRFSAEIENTYLVLTKAAAACAPRTIPEKPVPPGQPGVIKIIRAWDTTKLKTITSGLSVNQVYQLDQKGIEIENWTPGAEAPPPGNYSTRDYFIRLKTQKPFYMHGDRRQPFYLEPVTSRTTNTFTTVLSVPSANNTAPYTAISFNIKALYHPILTPGFLYSIIDGRGKVLYHSDTTKQLNENLFIEFSEHETLKAAIDAHTDKLFLTNYSGKKYTAYVSPFSTLPYQVVIMEDQSFTSVRAINNFVFSFSMLFAFFVALAAELLIVFIVSIKKQSYKKHYFDLSWIGPNKKFNHEYNLALFGNLVTILLICLFLGLASLSFFEGLFMLLAASSLSYLVLNLLYARAYKNAGSDQYTAKRNAIVALSAIVIIVNIIAAILTNIRHLVFFEIILIIVLGALWMVYERTPLKQWVYRQSARDFCKSFSIMTFTRLIITSGLPVLLFYISSFNYEVRLGGRYRHTLFTKAIKQQYALTPDSINAANLYRDGVWVNSDTFIADKPQIALHEDEHRTATLFGLLTINNDKLITGLTELDRTPKDGSWLYSSLFNTENTAGKLGITYHRLADQHYFKVQSLPLKYTLPFFTTDSNWYRGVAYWLLFIIAMAGFWYLLYNVLRRLFALNLPSDSYWEKIDELLLRNGKLNTLVFLIGAPGSGKLTKVISLVKKKMIKGINETPIVFDKRKPKEINYFVADMILIPNEPSDANSKTDWDNMKSEAQNDKYKLVIVNHFEYDIKNPASNRLKLTFLEDLLQKNLSKIIIISTVHPINFLDSLNQQQVSQGAAASDRSPEHDLERWHVLLGHFKIAVAKLDSSNPPVNINTPDWEKTLLYETRNGHFLKGMKAPLENRLKQPDVDPITIGPDGLALKLGITSHYFYMYMWQSLTKEEKFLLYDLAEDGLVNPFDDYNLILLISKGLVIREDGILKIFNNGFRNFILTAIGSSEANQIQQQIKDNGNWSKLKVPLIILIIALLAFLFTSQKEAYTTLIKYLTVITVGVPMVLKLSTFFGSDGGKAT